jgi:hypothetical protein
LICALLAAVLLIQNTTTAIGNSAGYNDRQRDRSAAQSHRQERLEKRRAELWEARKAELATAGNASVEEYEADIEGAKASNAKLWERSGGCLPEYIRGYEDRQAFCRSLAELEKKIAAAKARDEKDAQLAALEARDIDAERPAIESYVANMSRFLALFGITPDREVIASSRDWLRGIVIELLAMFGPEVTLLLIGMLALRPEPALVAQQKPDAPEKVKAAPTDAGTVGDSQASDGALASDDPHIDAFIARRLAFVAGSSILAGDLFKAWMADCAEHGHEPGSQKRFSARIQRHIVRDKNNGRPKYLGVHLKSRSVPILRVVSAH